MRRETEPWWRLRLSTWFANAPGIAANNCLMPQALHVQRFHIDHILAKKHVADERLDNLALACFRCNGYKGTDLSGIDPATGLLTRLFHPRQDRWSDHFRLEDGFILGVTDIGRVTVHVLNLNERSSVQLRRALIRRNLY